MAILTKWFKNKQEQDEMTSLLRTSHPVLNRLREILQEELQSSVKEQQSNNNYNSPSWALMQADFIGEQRALNKIIRLISIEE